MSRRTSQSLPAGWVTSPLEGVTEARVAQAGPRGENDFFYVDIGSIDNSAKKITKPKFLRPENAPSRAKQNLKSGDILVSMTRPNLNAVAVVPSELDGAIGSTGFHVLRVKQINSAWVFYAVQRKDFVDTMCQRVQGALYPAVRPKDIRAYQIPIPPLAEQKRIVAEIEKQFTRLDVGLASLRRLESNLRRYRSAILKAACEGRLVPTEAALTESENRKTKHETGEALIARILKERHRNWRGRGIYKEPIAPDTGKLPSLPNGWTWATVAQLAAHEPNSITDGPFGSNLKTEHYTASGPRVIRLKNIGDGVFVDEMAHISKAHFNRLQKHRVFANDIVIAGFGENPPRSCIIPGTLGPAIVKADCIRFRPHDSIVPKYINIVLNSDPIRRRTKGMVHGVGRPRLNLGEIRSIALPVPPFAEQTRIVAEVDRRLSVIEELEVVVFDCLRRENRLRQLILQKAFAGGLVLQERNDEPAETLLRRIRNESRRTLDPEIVMSAKRPQFMASKSIETLDQLLERLDALGGSAAPGRLLLAAGLDDNIEKFFDLLRMGRDKGHLSVPIGKNGIIRRRRNAN